MNDCESCNHKRHPDGGWCYMFRLEPRTYCSQHTRIDLKAANMRMAVLMAVLGAVKGEVK